MIPRRRPERGFGWLNSMVRSLFATSVLMNNFTNTRKIQESGNVKIAIYIFDSDPTQFFRAPMLIWLKAICFVAHGKRGISTLEVQSELEMKSYGTTWAMLHKIREAFRQRDEKYKLKNIIELDGAVFGKRRTGNQTDVLVATETKNWVDDKGRKKSKAGFAKIIVGRETKKEAQEFVDKVIEKDSMVNTDGSPSLINLENVAVDYQVVGSNQEILNHWLPWVHKFISNAKAWISGTHHGVESKYLGQYLAEYTYRFNRRHDPDSLFFRPLGACVHATPKTEHRLLR